MSIQPLYIVVLIASLLAVSACSRIPPSEQRWPEYEAERYLFLSERSYNKHLRRLAKIEHEDTGDREDVELGLRLVKNLRYPLMAWEYWADLVREGRVDDRFLYEQRYAMPVGPIVEQIGFDTVLERAFRHNDYRYQSDLARYVNAEEPPTSSQRWALIGRLPIEHAVLELASGATLVYGRPAHGNVEDAVISVVDGRRMDNLPVRRAAFIDASERGLRFDDSPRGFIAVSLTSAERAVLLPMIESLAAALSIRTRVERS